MKIINIEKNIRKVIKINKIGGKKEWQKLNLREVNHT